MATEMTRAARYPLSCLGARQGDDDAMDCSQAGQQNPESETTAATILL